MQLTWLLSYRDKCVKMTLTLTFDLRGQVQCLPLKGQWQQVGVELKIMSLSDLFTELNGKMCENDL